MFVMRAWNRAFLSFPSLTTRLYDPCFRRSTPKPSEGTRPKSRPCCGFVLQWQNGRMIAAITVMDPEPRVIWMQSEIAER